MTSKCAQDYLTPKPVVIGRTSSHEGSMQKIYNNKARVKFLFCNN